LEALDNEGRGSCARPSWCMSGDSRSATLQARALRCAIGRLYYTGVTTDRRSRLGILIVSALGVVFGDIGTSPLYAMRECFAGTHAIPVTTANVLGVLSLILWSLIITVSIKYVLFVMRADNGGEGGILALVALVRGAAGPYAHGALIAIGLFGAALLYG